MASELLTTIQDFAEDSEVKVVLLRGEGPLFMAGGDVWFFYKNLHQLQGKVDGIIETVHQVILAIYQLPKPVVASVHGSVAGVGMSFMMAADFAIASMDTKFTLAYSNIGTTPDGGATFALPRLVGTKKAMELAMLSNIFDATTAENLGLINYQVPPTDLIKATAKLTHKLAQGPGLVYARTKQLIHQSWHRTLEQQLGAEQESFAASTQTHDFHEGVTAFIEKRKPVFKSE